MKKLLIFIPLLLVGCGAFQSTSTTTTSTTTTTIDYGSDCNLSSYKKWRQELNKVSNFYLKDFSNASDNDINNFIDILEDIRFKTNNLSLTQIDTTAFILSIDNFVEDVYYYHYKSNSQSVVEVNISLTKFQREAKFLIANYYKECYEK